MNHEATLRGAIVRQIEKHGVLPSSLHLEGLLRITNKQAMVFVSRAEPIPRACLRTKILREEDL